MDLAGLTLAATAGCALLLAAFSAQRIRHLFALFSHSSRSSRPSPPALVPDRPGLPEVLVQLPLFNEPAVAARLIHAVVQLRWPSDRLRVQVLDDSDDDSAALVDAAVAAARADGVDVDVVRRAARSGFKAGALAHGLRQSEAPFVAIFDADFVPAPDFLLRAMAPFVDGDSDGAPVDVVQCRWGHLNRDASWLTRAQAAWLDAHFAIDQRGRAARGLFFPFNGTAGIWRRSAIDNAGGWSGATLTEDLDLSVRAWAQGARFTYRHDIVVDAELPTTMNAWKAQQARWARGGTQTARLRAATVWNAARPLGERVDALLRLAQNASFVPLLLLLALLPGAAFARAANTAVFGVVEAAALVLGTLPVVVALAVAGAGVVDAVAALVAGAALAVSNARAVMFGCVDGGGVFVRTPKAGSGRPARSARPPLLVVDVVLAAALLAAAAVVVVDGGLALVPFVPFLVLAGLGLAAGAHSSFVEALSREPRQERGEHNDDAGPERLVPHARLPAHNVAVVQEHAGAGEDAGSKAQAA